MGGICTAGKSREYDRTPDDSITTWRVFPTIEEVQSKYCQDPSLPKDLNPYQIELRTLLEEPQAQKLIGNYAREQKLMKYLMCWVDIQEFKTIPTDDYRRMKATNIFNKYLREQSVQYIDNPTDTFSKEALIDVINKTEEISIVDQEGNSHCVIAPMDSGIFDEVCLVYLFYCMHLNSGLILVYYYDI